MNPRRVSLRDFVPAGRSFSRWRASDLPEDVVFVGRPSRWGNPYKVGDECPGDSPNPACRSGGGPMDRAAVVAHYRVWARYQLAGDPDWLEPLHDKRLACYDPADDGLPCHTDVLLELGA